MPDALLILIYYSEELFGEPSTLENEDRSDQAETSHTNQVSTLPPSTYSFPVPMTTNRIKQPGVPHILSMIYLRRTSARLAVNILAGKLVILKPRVVHIELTNI